MDEPKVPVGETPKVPVSNTNRYLRLILRHRLVVPKAGPKTHGSIARSTQLVSGSARLDSFYSFNQLSQHFSSLQ